MIIDSFPYFNEKELLELRIRLLRDYVDKFIIIDSNRTHTGKPKPFTCKDTLISLGLFSEQTQVIEYDMSHLDNEPDTWVRERSQRDQLNKYVNDNDYCFVSDCDEIINPDSIRDHITFIEQDNIEVSFINMHNLAYRADLTLSNNQEGENTYWNSAYTCKGSMFKRNTPSYYREKLAWGGDVRTWDFVVSYIFGVHGWHFTWMGGSEKTKIKNISMAYHPGVNDKFDESFVPTEGGRDIFNRDGHTLSKFNVDNLPKLIWELSHVKKFLLPD